MELTADELYQMIIDNINLSYGDPGPAPTAQEASDIIAAAALGKSDEQALSSGPRSVRWWKK